MARPERPVFGIHGGQALAEQTLTWLELDIHNVEAAAQLLGHLASAISAHFSATVPNFRVMEIDIDGVPWCDEYVMSLPVFEDGDYIPPTGPGWGVEANEAAIRARPPKDLKSTV